MKITQSTLLLNDIRLKPSQIHKLRGFIGNMFNDYDLIHNHDPKTGKTLYRYPLIQFKLINGTPAIIALTERAVDIFSMLFMKLEQIRIEETIIPVFEKDFYVEKADFGYSDETFMYEFLSPWIALNQKNFQRYVNAASEGEKQGLLRKIIIGNILSMAKYLECWLARDQRIHADIRIKEKPVNLKGRDMIGFWGMFKTNFMIPDRLGIGKSVSRGFGTIRRVL